jgi:predicted phage terminase large subunit-like protein
MPKMQWDWAWLKFLRQQLRDVTLRRRDRLALSVPPQHGKTTALTIPYPLWRMLREPGLRVGICCHTQTYANKISRKIRRLVPTAGATFGAVNRADEWELSNGSTFICRGADGSIAGESLDLCIIDDPFGSREDADSPTIQEKVYTWYQDDVTPRIQEHGAIIIVHTRWGPADLIGRIFDSEEGLEWIYVCFKAIAEENDPLGRSPGEPLCVERFSLKKLEQRRRIEGIGFESLYQGNPIPRGGTYFERRWFPVVESLPPNADFRLVRYWDLAASRKDTACYTSGVLMAKVGKINPEFYIIDVIRGRWSPGDRNEVMRTTALADKARVGFDRTWYEKPVFDKNNVAGKAIAGQLAGHNFSADLVMKSKEVRAEPLSDAAKNGIVKIVAGPWVSAFLTELEGFPKTQYKDQVDSAAGAFAKLNFGAATVSVNGERIN